MSPARFASMRPPSNIVVASLWMIVISIALFFLPLINGLVGGIVGGYKAGSSKRGLLAALLPAAVIAVALWLLLMAFDAPVAGLFLGVGAAVLIVLADVGLVLGALIGGAYARSQRTRAIGV
jgi:hypothetical protein